MTKNKNQIAKVDNRVLEAFIQNNDLTAFKVLMYIGKSQIDKELDIQALDDNKLYQVPIKLNPLKDYFDLTSRQIREGIEKLNNTSIKYRKVENGKDKQTYINLLPKAVINYTDEVFDCYVFGEVLKLIYALTKFSKVNVYNFVKLEKKHSARMLMLLERLANYSKINEQGVDVIPKRQHYELEELNKLFGTKYTSYSLFIKRVLQPCKDDLDINSKLSFEFKAIKDRLGNNIKSRGRTPIVYITIDVVDNSGNLFAT